MIWKVKLKEIAVCCTVSFYHKRSMKMRVFEWKNPNPSRIVLNTLVTHQISSLQWLNYSAPFCTEDVSEKNALSYNDAQSIVCMGQAQNRLFLVCTPNMSIHTSTDTHSWLIHYEKLERHLHY